MNTTFHCGQIRLEHCGCQIKIQGWVKKIPRLERSAKPFRAMKYFSREFKTLRGVKIAIFFKRPYDWVRLKWKGNTILSQDYGVESCFLVRLGGKEKNKIKENTITEL